MLLRMYVRFCERQGFKVSTLDYQAGEGRASNLPPYLYKVKTLWTIKSENGIHRLVRISLMMPINAPYFILCGQRNARSA